MRAASKLPIITVKEPLAITSGGPTHVHLSVTRAAGWPPMITVGHPGGKIGPPTCGTGGVPGVIMGHVCISPTRAAGGIMFLCLNHVLFARFLSRLGIVCKGRILRIRLFGICRRTGTASASRPRGSATVNLHHRPLHCYAGWSDIHE